MTQMTIAPRLGRPFTGPATRGRTRVVDAAPTHSHTGFRLLCILVVAVTFTAVLLLNTARAEGSYILARLGAEATALHEEKVTLEARLADLESAETLARNARALEMVPSTSTATLRLSDGSITGVASMVVGGSTTTVNLPSTGVATVDD